MIRPISELITRGPKMSIQTRRVEYRDGDTVLEGYMAWEDTSQDKRPAILVAHTWRGRSEFEEGRVERLAELGYVAFALDLYGKGVLGSGPDENAALMQPFLDDREHLQKRLQLALSAVQKQKEVDKARIAAIGYCFGGLCVLDLARINANLRGVASFHGLLGAPGNTKTGTTAVKVLAMHGWDDPMVSPDQVSEFAIEMTSMEADWQVHAYGHTMHAFTNPAASDKSRGTVYSPVADHRSWQSLQLFLAEIFH